MHGHIRDFLLSNDPADCNTRNAIFHQRFQQYADWKHYLSIALFNSSVGSQLTAPESCWSVESFQALYVACWTHYPVEKGTYMLNLGELNGVQLGVIEHAISKKLSWRPSSHLSKNGHSASKGWAFLMGYHELLIQFERTAGVPYLMLKAEGHTTGLTGVVAHCRSWRHKKKTGEGLTASPALKAFAASHPDIVDRRAAENYDKPYKEMLKSLQLRGKQVTVREMMPRLFQNAGYRPICDNPATFFQSASNEQLGRALQDFCNTNPQLSGDGEDVGLLEDQAIIRNLYDLANSLISDGASTCGRVYNELRVSAAEIDSSLDYFNGH